MASGGQFPYDYDIHRGNMHDYADKLKTLELKQMPEYLSAECKCLISQMLEKDPQKRPNILKVLQTGIISQ
ncbi:hypothetical protein FGO68_gene10750 [Halteria grandinella]|uniref:Uncharacterized protein n=1 Tax=Halteria grandinella TaxID=5974 RepID=A0A8J8T5D9_HALGN|nr:hypothetical protein FGO68_gene10750 [Halteria grandinella]